MADEIIMEGNEDPQPLWNAPEITDPRTTTVPTGFFIRAATPDTVATAWSLQIMQGPKVIKAFESGGGSSFSYTVPQTLIPPGEGFYFKVDYYIPPLWSRWAWSGDLVMGLGKPVIQQPTSNSVVTTVRPEVTGQGYPGALIGLYQSGSGVILYGTTRVDNNGYWRATFNQDLGSGVFDLTANQNFNNLDSDWARTVSFTVLLKPTITDPVEGSVVTTRKPRVSGRGCPGATVKLYQAGSGAIVYGTADVNSAGRWETTLTESLGNGVFTLIANQTLNNVESAWSDTARFEVSAN